MEEVSGSNPLGSTIFNPVVWKGIDVKPVLSLLISFLGFTSICRAEDIFKYEPSIVTLQGTVSLQSFAGSPAYESTAQGDRLEQSWVLTLRVPIHVVAPPGDELFYSQEGVREIQLICVQDCVRTVSFSEGKVMTLVGTLFPAHTGHHHKGVLMTVLTGK